MWVVFQSRTCAFGMFIASMFLATALCACGGGGGGASPQSSLPATLPATPPTASATVTYLHVFAIDPLDGAQPRGPLLQASDGNFYGTTAAGGAYQCSPFHDTPCGTIFRTTPAGVTSVILSFGASASDGYSPNAPLIQGRDGVIYGTTAYGGDHAAGTIFKIALDGTYTVLYSFGASPTDGAVPTGALVQAGDGSFYGATSSGGSNHCVQIPANGGNCGTIFRMSPTGDTTVVYSFGISPSDGVEPNGSLLLASDGNLYGTTTNGGANSCTTSTEQHNCGTAFKMTLGGAMTLLHSFGTSLADGIAPQGGLIEGRDGAFYGTTASGGGGSFCYFAFACGTVFKMTSDGSVSILHAFAASSDADGDGPAPFLVQASDGNLYGTTNSGGATPSGLNGTAFRLSTSGTFTTLYSFGPLDTNPSNPAGGLIQGRDGAFYGVTFYNGKLGASGARGGFGTVFKMVVN